MTGIILIICGLIGFTIALVAKILIKILKIHFHKVHPNHVTVLEFWGGMWTITLQPGLYLVLDFDPLLVIKANNLPVLQFSIEPIAGLEENWDDWQHHTRHPIDSIDWDNVPSVEFDGGSTGLVEFMLLFKITDDIKEVNNTSPNNDTLVDEGIICKKLRRIGFRKTDEENPTSVEKFVYANEQPLSTIVMYTKGLLRDAYANLTFNEAIKGVEDKDKQKNDGDGNVYANTSPDKTTPDVHTFQKDLLDKIKLMTTKLGYGLDLIIPEGNVLVKNFYPCPDTKRGRADRFMAKQEGKATVERAIGDAKADKKRGKGWGKKIKAKAKNAGLTPQDAFAHENLQTAVDGLGDKTVVLNTAEGGLTNAMAGVAGVTNAMQNSAKQLPSPQQNSSGGDQS